MIITKTKIKDLIILKPKIHVDKRGFFMESYNRFFFNKNIDKVDFLQDNESESRRGVLRGLHFQLPPFDQAKLVRVIKGKVLDVAVDLRKKSSTYGKYESVILSSENNKQFYIPRGFAHGFVVLSNSAIFSYKVDNVYSPEYDSGIFCLDKTLNIDWKLNEIDLVISKKDSSLSNFKDFKSPF